MNELVLKEFGTVTAAKDYAATLMAVGNSGPNAANGLPILKIGKDDGEWCFGEGNTPVEENDVWLVHAMGIEHGYIAFSNKEPAVVEYEDDNGDMQPAEFLVPLTTPIQNVLDELPELDEETFKRNGKRVTETPEYKFTFAVTMRCIEGENEGEVVVYKPTSVSGTSLVRKIIKEIANKINKGMPFLPVLALASKSYEHKSYGTVHTPEFELLEFTDQLVDFSTEEETEEETPKAKKPPRKAAPRKEKPASKPATKSKAKKPQPVEEEEFEDEEEFEEDEILELEEDEYEEIEEDEIEEDEIEEDEVEEKPKASTRKKRATKPVAGAVKKTAPKAAQETAQKRTRKKRGQA